MAIEYSSYMSVCTLRFEHYPLIVWPVVTFKGFDQSLIFFKKKNLFTGV